LATPHQAGPRIKAGDPGRKPSRSMAGQAFVGAFWPVAG